MRRSLLCAATLSLGSTLAYAQTAYQLEVIARAGMTFDSRTIRGVESDDFSVSLNDHGQFVFLGQLPGAEGFGYSELFSGDLRTGQIQNLAGRLTPYAGSAIRNFYEDSLRIDNAGRVSFAAVPVRTPQTFESVLYRGGSVYVAPGQQIDGVEIISFTSGASSTNASGDLAWQAATVAPNAAPHAVFLNQTFIARSGTLFAGEVIVNVRADGYTHVSDAGDVLFAADLPGDRAALLRRNANGAQSIVVKVGDTIPGAGQINYLSPTEARITPSGGVAYLATVDDPNSTIDETVLVIDGQIRARKNGAIGGQGFFRLSERDGTEVNDLGQFAFIATAQESNPYNRDFLFTSEGLVVKPGTVISGAGGGSITVDTLGGEAWDLNNRGELIFAVLYNDPVHGPNSTALVHARPAVPTWGINANGSWQAAANWQGPGVPDGVGAKALFSSVIGAPRTVSSSSIITLGEMTFRSAQPYTLAGSGTILIDASAANAEGGLVRVREGSHQIQMPLELLDPTTLDVRPAGSTLTLSGGVLSPNQASLVKSGAGRVNAKSLQVGALSVQSGVLRVTPSLGGVVKTTSVSVAGGATLDITNNAMIIDYSGASPLATIAQRIRSGRSSGDWQGTGITSGLAANTVGYSLGYAEAGAITPLTSVFGNIDATTLLLRVVRDGDADLDGSVEFDDLLILARNYGQSSDQHWFEGDFDFDGATEFDDLLILARYYGMSGLSSEQSEALDAVGSDTFHTDLALAWAIVPEPTAAVAMLGLSLVARRRRTVSA